MLLLRLMFLPQATNADSGNPTKVVKGGSHFSFDWMTEILTQGKGNYSGVAENDLPPLRQIRRLNHVHGRKFGGV
jgi:hypothetical protein